MFDCLFGVLTLKTGIYFLTLNDVVQYVGLSIDIDRRILQHRRSGKIFDSFVIVLTSIENLRAFEREFMFEFKPPLNRFYQGAGAKRRRLRSRDELIRHRIFSRTTPFRHNG